MESTAYLYFEAIPKLKTSFITLKETSEISDYSVDYLNVMARRGSIPAFKLKRNWVVFKKSFLDYIKEKKRSSTSPRMCLNYIRGHRGSSEGACFFLSVKLYT